jgi:predicted dehydrogenase
MNDILKAGVIGVGYLGRFHAQKYAAMENVELVGVADTDPMRAQLVAEECSTQAFSDYQELLPLVDAVSIAVPTLFHHQVAKDCLQRSVDIMVEKPITTTLEEADELIDLARRGQRIFQVGHLERFNPAVLALQPQLTHPLFIEAHRLGIFKERGTDVDVVLDLMIHDIDIILSIVKADIETIVTAGAPVITPLTDIANARIIFTNGCTANITVSRISLESMRRMRIFQPGRYLSVDFGKKEVMAVKLKPGTEGTHPVPEIEKSSFPDQDALELELRDFIRCVRDRSQPSVSGAEGRRALDVALQVVTQINANREKFKELLGEECSLNTSIPSISG